MLTALIREIERDPLLTYYAINKRGDLRTNTHSEGPNAVTWGVFPGKEIVQPTIVEAVSFMAWKARLFVLLYFSSTNNPFQDEAFELGMQWSKLYDLHSPSQTLIADVMESWTLVNVVHNDFRDPEAIFAPFYRAAQSVHTIPDGSQSNGVPIHAVPISGVTNGLH